MNAICSVNRHKLIATVLIDGLIEADRYKEEHARLMVELRKLRQQIRDLSVSDINASDRFFDLLFDYELAASRRGINP